MVNEREEAYKIIVKVLKKNMFSDNLLQKSQAKIKKQNGNHDLFYTLVKGVIKMHRNLDYIASRFTDEKKFANTDLKIKVFIYLGIFQIKDCDNIPDHAAVHETVELAKKLMNQKIADFVNAVIRNFLRKPEIIYNIEDTAERIGIEYSFPTQIIREWIKYYGEEQTEYLCMYFNDVPKLNIRVNKTATSVEKVINYFAKKGVSMIPSNASPSVVCTDSPQEVINDVTFSEGYFTIQDAAAAMVVDLLNPQKHESILDLFAGPGGKCTYISEKVENTGEVIAVDKIPNKVKKIKKTAERLQLTNIKLITTDSYTYGPVAPVYDHVLLDVPCSGWGVFQKKSELRWQKAQDMNNILKLQEAALSYGAKFVAPGGYIVYSTCTLNRRENFDQIKKFLEQHKDFTLIDAKGFIPAEFVSEGCLMTTPHVHNIDGAFAAKLQKKL